MENEPRLRVVQARDGNKIAGFIVVVDRACKPRSFVIELHVHPDYRRCGLGRQLLTEALGVAAAELHCHPGNDEARCFYERVGFLEQPKRDGGMRVMRRRRGGGL